MARVPRVVPACLFLFSSFLCAQSGDKRSVFADKLVMPRAISLVGDGLLVAEPPHLWFLRDTNAVLKRGQAAQIDRVIALAVAVTTPESARTAILGGVRHFLPRSPDGKSPVAKLPAEPMPLVALAIRSGSPDAAVAQQLLEQLKRPGKPGAQAATVRPLTAAEQARFEKGKMLFAALCAACHQPNGQGLEGLAPPLINSRWVLGDGRVLSRILLNGKARENLIMPPWKAAFDDEAIAAVLTFIRRSWEHDADPVEPSTVAEARRATADRDEPYTDPELEELTRTLRPRKRTTR
ncbi:MAG: c-type cytochrome [Opitutaceae bacterium]|nr:c-type cytochrome [Opitutaceae bacterium]